MDAEHATTIASPEPATSTTPVHDPSCPNHALPALPDDVAVLQTMIRELLQSLKTAQRERDGLAQRLDLLLRKLYGPKAERFDPNQPWLIPEMAPDAADSAAAPDVPPDAEATTTTKAK